MVNRQTVKQVEIILFQVEFTQLSFVVFISYTIYRSFRVNFYFVLFFFFQMDKLEYVVANRFRMDVWTLRGGFSIIEIHTRFSFPDGQAFPF